MIKDFCILYKQDESTSPSSDVKSSSRYSSGEHGYKTNTSSLYESKEVSSNPDPIYSSNSYSDVKPVNIEAPKPSLQSRPNAHELYNLSTSNFTPNDYQTTDTIEETGLISSSTTVKKYTTLVASPPMSPPPHAPPPPPPLTPPPEIPDAISNYGSTLLPDFKQQSTIDPPIGTSSPRPKSNGFELKSSEPISSVGIYDEVCNTSIQKLPIFTASSQAEIARPAALKSDIGKLDSSKLEIGGLDSSKSEIGRRNSSKPETVRWDPPKSDYARRNSAKPEIGRLDSSKFEYAGQESSKTEIGRRDSSKPEIGRLDSSKFEYAGQDSSKPEIGKPKPEIGRLDSSKFEFAGQDSSKPEIGRQDSSFEPSRGRFQNGGSNTTDNEFYDDVRYTDTDINEVSSYK